MSIDTTKKIKQVTYNGTEIPLRGYDTSDATVTAGDMPERVTGYGKVGKVTGNVLELKSGEATNGIVNEIADIGSGISVNASFRGTIFARSGSAMLIPIPYATFGDATAADVAKGKTFTSAAGFKAVGTAEVRDPIVMFHLTNNYVANITVVYMTKTDGILEKTIANYGSGLEIAASKDSMVILIDTSFSGETIDLVPDNGVSIAQGWRTTNVTMFVAGAETDGMNIDVNVT